MDYEYTIKEIKKTEHGIYVCITILGQESSVVMRTDQITPLLIDKFAIQSIKRINGRTEQSKNIAYDSVKGLVNSKRVVIV